MRTVFHWLGRNLMTFIFLGIWLLLIMFINFNAKVAQNTRQTKDIVDSQTVILNAIKDSETDNKLTSEQKTNLIICMLQVPVAQRTTNVLNNCRKAAEASPSSPALTQTNSPTKTNNASGSSSLAPTNSSQHSNPTTSPGLVTQSVQAVNRDIVKPVVKFVKGIHI